MKRAAAAMILASIAYAQNARQAGVAEAAKSPVSMARYVEAHAEDFDWDALWNALGTPAPKTIYPLCGGSTIYSCSTEIVTVLSPDQTIVIIQSGGIRTHDVYLRYLQQPDGGWRFAGERLAVLYDDYPRRHEVGRIGSKPFLKISSDLSQVGGGFGQRVEDWFDLTLPDFEPAFSFTAEGSLPNFGFRVNRNLKAQTIPVSTSGIERINLILSVTFTGLGRSLAAEMYTGVYERSSSANKFTLRRASQGFAGLGTATPTEDFEALEGAGLTDEQALVYALPGLQQIATGSDAEAKKWLREALAEVKDTPEKRQLLDLLGK
jgi:hypothetical protein